MSFDAETKWQPEVDVPDIKSKFTGLCDGCDVRFLDDRPVRSTEMYVESLKSPELRQAEALRATLSAGALPSLSAA